MVFTLAACGNSDTAAQDAEPPEQTGEASGGETSAVDGEQNGSTGRLIAVQFEENTVVYQLNDGTAADSLFAQLPFTVEIEDYSTNEKIFYPPQELDTGSSPLAEGGAGTLAYYAPWGDVVMFYEDFSGGSGGLYELGKAVEGADAIRSLSGTITVTAA